MTWITQYMQMIKVKYMSRFQYPLDFLFSFFAFFMAQATGPILVLGLYSAGAAFEGWTMWELILLQGVFSTVAGVAFTLFWGMGRRMNSLVRKGYFEVLRIRPVPTLWMLIMTVFDEEDVSQFFSGVIILAVSLFYVNTTAENVGAVFLFAFIGLLVLFALALTAASLVLIFVTIPRINEFLNAFLNVLKFPKDAYTKYIPNAIVSVFPLFFVNAYPTQVLLGKPISGIGIGLIAVGVMVICSGSLWLYAVSQYEGAGG